METLQEDAQKLWNALKRDAAWISGWAAFCSLLGVLGVAQSFREERELQARQGVHAQAQALGAVMQSGLETLTRELNLVMDEKLRKGEGAEFDREILDISLWIRKDPASKPVRTVLGLNSNYITPLQEFAIRARANDPGEVEKFEPAFDGKWVIAPIVTTELGSSFLVAVPSSKAASAGEAVVAHVRQGYLLRYFKPESPYQAIFLKSTGKMLLSSPGAEEAIGAPEELVKVASSYALPSGYLRSEAFRNGAKTWGAYRQLLSGQFTMAVFGPASIMQYQPFLDSRLFLGGTWLFAAVFLCGLMVRVLDGVRGKGLPGESSSAESSVASAPVAAASGSFVPREEDGPTLTTFVAARPAQDPGAAARSPEPRGEPISVAPEMREELMEADPQLWWVSNGVQTLGPMEPAEIAARLFSQDLDFDCTCWPEGQDERLQLPLAESGLFAPPSRMAEGQPNHPYWVFLNGEGILGPYSLEEVLDGRFPEDTYVCEESTVQGWSPYAEWKKNLETNVLNAERNQTNRSAA